MATDRNDPRRRQPVSTGLMCDILVDVVRKLRTERSAEILTACNEVRKEMGLPIIKARVRTPATMGRRW